MPHFFAITSVRPDGTHFFVGDWDNCIYGSPVTAKTEFLIETSPNHYHVIDFGQSSSLESLIKEQTLRGCDPSFIRATKAYGFSQLTIHGKIIKRGKMPCFPLRIVLYNDSRQKSLQ